MLNNTYASAKEIRFSCAYLFRIKLGNKYFLVKDEQGRNTYQPVGGAYKYYCDDLFAKTHAVQCTRFGTTEDLDNDLRVIVPRKYVGAFRRWYAKEAGRENPDNLYREFREEVLDRISSLDDTVFETIHYKFCGTYSVASRYGENKTQVHIADIVELLPTPQQTKELCRLQEEGSGIYCFATKEEIYNLGCVNGNQVPTISAHTYKILTEEEHRLKHTHRSGKFYSCSNSDSCGDSTLTSAKVDWTELQDTDTERPFAFISYQSLASREVWRFCKEHEQTLGNIWLDRRNVGENWFENVKDALNSENCRSSVIFMNKNYLNRSPACYREAELICRNRIPHVIILTDIDRNYIQKIIRDWIYTDGADKEKLRVFKKLFNYNDDTGHIETSVYELSRSNTDKILQTFQNLSN